MKRLFAPVAAVLALVLVTITACGPASRSDEPTVEPTPTPSDALPEPPTSESAEPATTPSIPSMPGMPDNLCAQPPTVINFDVWQDFMPGPKSGNSLHVSLIVELVCPTNITPADISGSIIIKRKSGELITTTPLQLDSMADTATTGVKQLSLTIRQAPPTITLTEGELVTGTATLTIGQDQVEIPLPETELAFTH